MGDNAVSISCNRYETAEMIISSASYFHVSNHQWFSLWRMKVSHPSQFSGLHLSIVREKVDKRMFIRHPYPIDQNIIKIGLCRTKWKSSILVSFGRSSPQIPLFFNFGGGNNQSNLRGELWWSSLFILSARPKSAFGKPFCEKFLPSQKAFGSRSNKHIGTSNNSVNVTSLYWFNWDK